MHSSKLVSILKQFNEQEWKAFRRFVDSPYFNRRPKLVNLLDLVKKTAPQWSKKKLAKTYIYSKLFPNEPYVEKRLVGMRNALIKLIEQYWLISNKMNTPQVCFNLAVAYHQKGLYNYSEAYFERSLSSIASERLDVSAYHRHLVDFHLSKHNLIEAERKRNQEPNLQNFHDQFDAYYLCIKLKYYYKVLNYQNLRSHTYDISMIEEVLTESAKVKYQMYPSIQIYYHAVYSLLSLDNENNFFALSDLLKQHTQTFSIEELQDIFIIARNFCIKNFNRGKRNYIREALDLYKIEISEGIIFEDDKISDFSCRNIIKSALLQSEVTWASAFLERYKEKISEAAYQLSLANVHFSNRHYLLVLEVLLNTNFKDVLLELAARGLILKTYFQLCRTTDNFEFEDKLDAYIESFKTFLKRKKEALTKGYLLYLNLIKFIQAINKLYWQPKLDKSKLANIHQKILETPKTAEWEWLKEISNNET